MNIYHVYQILISDSSRSRLSGSLLQTQGYFKVLCNISLTNFIPSSSIYIRHHIYHSYQILISDSSRSRIPGSLLRTQGTSRYYATFLSQISFLPLPIKLDIIYISFISNPHIRFLQIKDSRITTSNAGNFKVLCNIYLTNFLPSASNQLNSLKSIQILCSRINSFRSRFTEIFAICIIPSLSLNL